VENNAAPEASAFNFDTLCNARRSGVIVVTPTSPDGTSGITTNEDRAQRRAAIAANATLAHEKNVGILISSRIPNVHLVLFTACETIRKFVIPVQGIVARKSAALHPWRGFYFAMVLQ